MIDKRVSSASEAVTGIQDGHVVLVSGFGDAGLPFELVEGILSTPARELTVVANNAGGGDEGIAALIKEGRIRRIVCSYPRMQGSVWFEKGYFSGEIELELVPQGTLSERIRAGGAGIGAFFTPTGVGTQLAEGKETRDIDGRTYVLEYPIHGDFALVKADIADRWGNLVYRGAARNYAPTMAMAADVTVAQVSSVVGLGGLEADRIVTPGIFVDRVVEITDDRRVRSSK